MNTYITFTRRNEAPLLPLWQAGIRRLDPCSQCVAVVQQAVASMPLPRGIQRLVANFDRGANLTGLACIHGVLATMAGLGKLTGGPVIKLDASCILASTAWLGQLEGARDFVFFEGLALAPQTAIFACTAHGAIAIQKQLQPWPWRQDDLPAVQAIYQLAIKSLGRKCTLEPSGKYPLLSMEPIYYGAPALLHCPAAAINCNAPIEGVPRIARTRRGMKLALRALYHRHGLSSVLDAPGNNASPNLTICEASSDSRGLK